MKKLLLCCLLLPIWPLSLQAEPAELLNDHPLVGSIWHPAENRQVNREEVFAAAFQAHWILLGEKHDNAEHHRIQAEVVAAIGERGRRPALVWEMAEPKHDAALKAARLEGVDALGPAIEWEQRGWPSWAEYQPIAEQALKYGMTMAAGDAPRAIRRELGKGGTLEAETADAVNWSRDYDDDQRSRLMELLALSHCGMLPEKVLPAMVDIQRLRDAWIAKVMREEDAGEGAILIAGAQHVRADRAVPWHLEPHSGEVFTLAVVEVVRGEEDPTAYPSFDPEQFDYVWFTARVDEKDPCEAFRKS